MKNIIPLSNFEYSNSVGRITFKTYKEQYFSSLNKFLNEYEDNTEAFYLYCLIPEWEEVMSEMRGYASAIKSDDNEVFYYIRNRIDPSGLPDIEDSSEVKLIMGKLAITEDEDERKTLYCELAEVWRKEEEEEQKEDEENWRFPNWREVENKELEKSDCIKLLNRNLATCFLFIDFLKKREKEIQTEMQTEQPQQVKNTPPQSEAKAEQEKIKAPVLALFCSLINEIGIDKQGENESATSYCKRICEKHNLTYTDRVRQNYYGKKSKINQREFDQMVLPLLDAEMKTKIQKHLDTKQLPK